MQLQSLSGELTVRRGSDVERSNSSTVWPLPLAGDVGRHGQEGLSEEALQEGRVMTLSEASFSLQARMTV